MKMFPPFLFLCLFGFLAGCHPNPVQAFDAPAFSFEFPKGWQLMSDLWPDYQPEQDYYHLGLQEVVMVTSVKEQGQAGAYFAVAVKPLQADSDLETLFHQTYAPILDEIREMDETTLSVAGGEPWWQFRDIWLEKDGVAYVLSFHALDLEKYQAEIAYILDHFAFK